MFKENVTEITSLAIKILYRESGGIKSVLILAFCFFSYGFLGVYINR
jgi:hypothetical protein